jgi:hypothetical protein
MAKQWIQKAVKHPGSFTAQAKKAGMGVQEYASKVTAKGSKASKKTKARARLAKILRRLSKKKKRAA